jgi:UDP-N-acetylmuramate--alanine ligase
MDHGGNCDDGLPAMAEDSPAHPAEPAGIRVNGTRLLADISGALVWPERRALVFADCALNVAPTADELAAIAVAHELEVPVEAIRRGLEGFQGIGRRFHNHGELPIAGGKVTLIDDYGHHPRELAAVLDAIRGGWPGRRLVLAFQPHRYSRTQDLFDDFAKVLSEADLLLLTDVYPAGERPVPGADGRSLSRAIRMRGKVNPVFVERAADLPEVLPPLLEDGDILLLMGAGDIGSVASNLGREGLWNQS